MALTLPTTPAPRMLGARLVPPPRELRPETGEGTIQRITGFQRWVVDFELPPMTYVQAMAWEPLFASNETVLMPIYQPGLDVGEPGTDARVDGADQSGSTLNVRLLPNDYPAVTGQRFSIQTGGRYYLHQLTADVTADGTGDAAWAIRPMLRVSPSGSGVIHLDPPYVEGFVTLEGGVTISVDRLVHGIRFSIEEVR